MDQARPICTKDLTVRNRVRLVTMLAAASLLCGCESSQQDVRSQPLMVPEKQSIWSSWGEPSPESRDQPLGTPFQYDTRKQSAEGE